MSTVFTDRLLREVDARARALHDPRLAADEIISVLERAVVDLGLAEEAVFVPQAMREGAPRGEAVDVHREEGSLSGALHCTGLADDAVWPVRMLASHAGAALDERARNWDARRRESALRAVSETLQDALLPEPPVLEHTTMHVSYRAASTEARVGGDFYDVFELPDGRVLTVVGDVVGKGVIAATHTSRITHTLRSLALQGYDLDELLERCDQQISFQDPDLIATVWCGLYDPGNGELSFASLGHPPALLLRAEGDPISLALEGLPLGLRDLSEDVPEIRTRRLAARDLLVLYTDGVVEASKDYVAGQKALLAAIESRRDEPLADVVQGVLDEMLTGAGHRDDAVMLLLRRR